MLSLCHSHCKGGDKEENFTLQIDSVMYSSQEPQVYT